MKKSAGFTLVELLVVLSITAILVALAAPSFTQTIRSVNMSSAVNTFLADANYARSEAVRRGGDVIMCRSTNPDAAVPTCATGTAWESGWIIFHDRDDSADYNFTSDPSSDDELLRRQSAITAVNTITKSGSSTTKLVFTATGRLKSLNNGAMTLQFGSTPNFSNEEQRIVCINVGGRVRIKGDGYTSCP